MRSERTRYSSWHGLTVEGYAQAWANLPLCRCLRSIERGLGDDGIGGNCLCRDCRIERLERDADEEDRSAERAFELAADQMAKADDKRARAEPLRNAP